MRPLHSVSAQSKSDVLLCQSAQQPGATCQPTKCTQSCDPYTGNNQTNPYANEPPISAIFVVDHWLTNGQRYSTYYEQFGNRHSTSYQLISRQIRQLRSRPYWLVGFVIKFDDNHVLLPFRQRTDCVLNFQRFCLSIV